MAEKPSIQRIKQRQAEHYEKAQRHIDPRVQRLVLVNQHRRQYRAGVERGLGIEQFAREQVNQHNPEGSVNSRWQPYRRLIKSARHMIGRGRGPVKQRWLGWHIRGALERHQPFAAAHDVLHRHRLARLAFVEKRSGSKIREIENGAEEQQQRGMDSRGKTLDHPSDR